MAPWATATLVSGTSQAAPYVSTTATTYLVANSAMQVTDSQVEAALVASVQLLPKLNTGQPPVSSLRSGGGLVDIAFMLTSLSRNQPQQATTRDRAGHADRW